MTRLLFHLVLSLHFALLCAMTALAQSTEADMDSDAYFKSQFKEMAEKPLRDFKRKVGYYEAIRNEKEDGLIVVDFRKAKLPPFVTKSYGWNFYKSHDNNYKGDYYYFRWKLDNANSNDAGALIEVKVFSDYEGARKKIIRTAESVNTMTLPWVPCKNEVGTVCAEDRSLFFVYRNVFVEIVSGGSLPNGEPLRDELAAWLFDILARHPRTRVFPETPDELSEAEPETKIPVPPSAQTEENDIMALEEAKSPLDIEGVDGNVSSRELVAAVRESQSVRGSR
jgi:hypothetical protein